MSQLPQKKEAVVRLQPTLQYEWGGEVEAALTAKAAEYRDGFSPGITATNQFKNINGGYLPWESNNGFMSVSTAMLLMQRAYANVAIFRNAVESAVEFSNSPLHIKTDNKTVKDFFTMLFDRWNIWQIKDQFFRNRYREGNGFIYTHMGRIEEEKYAQMKSVFGAKSPYIPIRFTTLNPTQVYLANGVINGQNYVKMLSQYEVLRLRSPKTKEDKQVFDSLPEQTKKEIMKGNAKDIFIPLDPARLTTSFYKKQDFEPMAIPMGYPLLNDLEWKLELKKMDMSLSRTVEHVLLLVTTGEKAEEWGGGGINPQSVANLQNIFRNQTLGRVLVADYTTNAEWKIPDIAAILGPEKYKQVEKDIQEGLQSIFVGGEDKFANASIKAKIYSERMKEGQKAFLHDFLLPQVKMICEAMGFRDVPEIEFEQINIDDMSQRERVILRLAEIGILTPDETFTALESGVLPDKISNLKNQEEYKKARDKELYTPLIGGGKKEEGGEGRPAGGGTKKTVKKVGKIGTTKAEVSASELANMSVRADQLVEQIERIFCLKQNVNELSPAMKDVAKAAAKVVIAHYEPRDWLNAAPAYLGKPVEMNKTIAALIDDTAMEFDTNDWEALLIWKSRQ